MVSLFHIFKSIRHHWECAIPLAAFPFFSFFFPFGNPYKSFIIYYANAKKQTQLVQATIQHKLNLIRNTEKNITSPHSPLDRPPPRPLVGSGMGGLISCRRKWRSKSRWGDGSRPSASPRVSLVVGGWPTPLVSIYIYIDNLWIIYGLYLVNI